MKYLSFNNKKSNPPEKKKKKKWLHNIEWYLLRMKFYVDWEILIQKIPSYLIFSINERMILFNSTSRV